MVLLSLAFFILFDNFCLLIGAFGPLPFNVIMDMIGLESTVLLLVVFDLFSSFSDILD